MPLRVPPDTLMVSKSPSWRHSSESTVLWHSDECLRLATTCRASRTAGTNMHAVEHFQDS